MGDMLRGRMKWGVQSVGEREEGGMEVRRRKGREGGREGGTKLSATRGPLKPSVHLAILACIAVRVSSEPTGIHWER